MPWLQFTCYSHGDRDAGCDDANRARVTLIATWSTLDGADPAELTKALVYFSRSPERNVVPVADEAGLAAAGKARHSRMKWA